MATATMPRAVCIEYFPCPTCAFDGIPWARVYPTDQDGEHYYCPTCRNKYTLQEVQ